MKNTTLFLILLLAGLPLFGVSYEKDAKIIIDRNCAPCHRGPYLDLRSFPFESDVFQTQGALVREMIRRTELTDLKRMPPVNFPALTGPEIQVLKNWLAGGLKP